MLVVVCTSVADITLRDGLLTLSGIKVGHTLGSNRFSLILRFAEFVLTSDDCGSLMTEHATKGGQSLIRLVFGLGTVSNGILSLVILLLEFVHLVTTDDGDFCVGTSAGSRRVAYS
jgi:hypothetical protein